ncbi:transcriptional regulator, IclR family [Roseateles sp. YR242]|uniref:IclR family transcriptional regulator domain-containing protein n=1 Tax=Roseateles sp. YR242 TaxID=1855305 RepID=UPI0008B767A6|nr:IclR family transcriptional regulator C-terminal domain-containing protein [Roseateles sp. YR242]SEL67605.1 transcriptional regulator, IclR family [Roseateles sp. YR242]
MMDLAQGAEYGAEIDRKDLIEGLGKGLRVMEAFDDDHPRLTPTEVARLTGLTRTAARRYLLSLVHFGYAGTDGKLFWLTARVLRLSQSYLGASRLPRLVQPFIQRISMQCGETVNVSILDGHEVVYVARSNSPRVVSVGYQPGSRIPAHVVAPGVVLLAAMTEPESEQWLARHDFRAFTCHTVVAPEAFRQHVRAARALDFWIASKQLDPGLCGIATVLRDRKGTCKGAVSMTLPAATYSEDEMRAKLLPLLFDTAQTLRPLL